MLNLKIKNKLKGISKNAPFPLHWRGIKGEAKQIIRVFRDALKLMNETSKASVRNIFILLTSSRTRRFVLEIFGLTTLAHLIQRMQELVLPV